KLTPPPDAWRWPAAWSTTSGPCAGPLNASKSQSPIPRAEPTATPQRPRTVTETTTATENTDHSINGSCQSRPPWTCPSWRRSGRTVFLGQEGHSTAVTIVAHNPPFVIEVDTHARTHVLAILTATGQQVD